VVLRTLSKAWGLAGLRVGFAVASPTVLGWLRAAGHPYAVSGPSAALALRWLDLGREAKAAYCARVPEERSELEAALAALGGQVHPSAGNFAFARVSDAIWIRDGLAGLGIGIRAFPGDPLLDDAVRITCPGEPADQARLLHALDSIARPEALLFDMDGVLVDVSQSYREAIRLTASRFGVELSAEDIAHEKERGHASNDWILTRRLLALCGVEVELEEVTRVFEELYQGSPGTPGLRQHERLLVPRELLEALRARLPLGIVTGRPRQDAERLLGEHTLAPLFDALVTMEDAPAKPDPAPVRLALERLGVGRAWMVGDMPDDVRAARRAAVLPLGARFGAARDDAGARALTSAGAARVLSRPQELKELLP
jgi:HAD superfamily hydrolase (TIGR01548 family)